jgi:hypothetical protein
VSGVEARCSCGSPALYFGSYLNAKDYTVGVVWKCTSGCGESFLVGSTKGRFVSQLDPVSWREEKKRLAKAKSKRLRRAKVASR